MDSALRLLQPRQHHERLDVGAQIKKVLGMNLAGHDRMAGAGFFEKGEHSSELADAHPFDLIHERRERGVGFILKSSRHDPRDARLAAPPAPWPADRRRFRR